VTGGCEGGKLTGYGSKGEAVNERGRTDD